MYKEYYPDVPWVTIGQLNPVEFPPERRKLHPLQRTPVTGGTTKPVKDARHLIDYRGPEQVRNKLLYGQYGIQVIFIRKPYIVYFIPGIGFFNGVTF